jgi:hypothetical protein
MGLHGLLQRYIYLFFYLISLIIMELPRPGLYKLRNKLKYCLPTIRQKKYAVYRNLISRCLFMAQWGHGITPTPGISTALDTVPLSVTSDSRPCYCQPQDHSASTVITMLPISPPHSRSICPHSSSSSSIFYSSLPFLYAPVFRYVHILNRKEFSS